MGARLAWVTGGVIVIVIAIVAFFGYFALQRPGPLKGPATDIHLEVVAAVGSALEWPRPNDPHPDWVGYLPTTVLRVPANSTINMTIDQEDSATGLRNPFWARVQGTTTGSMHVKYFDDKGNPQEGDMTSIDPTQAAHTFAIPDLGVFVPLLGVNANAPANSMNVITFSFHTPGKGVYHWQCFVPCGAKTVFGNGGPMQTYGYMAGQLIVE
ncbi:MAG TPA: hypothetical protein VET65_12100 [Candidatus Limnocylindrales bacterium]|nr:hypothetical protein [Candidatus Limnocylindrales bacterium]